MGRLTRRLHVLIKKLQVIFETSLSSQSNRNNLRRQNTENEQNNRANESGPSKKKT